MKKIALLLIVVLLGATLTDTEARRRKKVELPEIDTNYVTGSDIVTRTVMTEQDFTTMNMSKFRMSMQFGEQRFALSGSVRMIKDSLIAISIQPLLGIEVARVELFEDRVMVYDKMYKRYGEAPYETLQYALGIPVDFDMMQAVLMNRLNLDTEEKDDTTYISSKYHLEETTDSSYILLGNKPVNGCIPYIEVNKNDFRIKVLGIVKDRALLHFIEYGNIQNIGGVEYPMQMSGELDHDKFYLKADVTVEKVIFNKEVYNPVIPTERYNIISVAQFMDLFKGIL